MSIEALIRVAAFGLLLAGVAVIGSGPAGAADPRGLPPPPPPPVAEPLALEGGMQFVQLGVGKSVVIDLPRDVKDVLVANPEIANAVIRSSRRAYLIGGKVGQTSVFFFDETGAQLAGFDIAVTRDLNGLRASMKRMFPNADITIEGVGPDGVMLGGTVASPDEAQRAYDIAVRLAGGDKNVVNGITIKGRDQVLLKVTVAEVKREIFKQLGIDLNGSIGSGNAVLKFNTDNPFTATGKALSDTAIAGTFGGNVTATVQAMERAGVVRTLAEPNLTTVSGEAANFLVGGEFPYPVPATSALASPSIDFKKFGISLSFTPVVMSEGRISLRVNTEVSELDYTRTVSINFISVPSLKVRRAGSLVEIPSGGALAMAGLIQEDTKQAINGLPGLLQVPILGTLFRSRDYVNNQTELVILVTPYIVRPTAPKNLSRPDDGYADIGDPSAVLLGRFNRIYGVTGSAEPSRTYFGRYGFILD